MKSHEIRQAFIDYFKTHGHSQVSSSSLIPENDATLLFANAGMNQFKNLFLGLEQRDYTRAVSTQKCVRAGGKHNDLENVGHTARHHTFFEMLGNFSFGDYFKKEAIHFAWDFLTNTLKIDKDRLYVTVHISDDEAAQIWQTQEGVPADRISRFDDDNFWRMGDVGPCGPCSEIFYDHGPDADPSGKSFVGGDGDRYVEIWNLVFMQFNEDENGKQPLPNPSIDTGSGLERLTSALQGKPNNYDTDVFTPIIGRIVDLTGKPYKTDDSSQENQEILSAMRVMADHARSTAFLMADGVFPSNEGRGYVLRRIMRRALRYGKKLADGVSLFPALTQAVIESMGDFYPELKQKEALIVSATKDEEERFLQTLDQGIGILNEEIKKASSKTLSGEAVFRLYDTYGFPVDLTRLMAAEQGYQLDEKGFEENMSAAREKARSSWKGQGISSNEAHLVEWAQKFSTTRFSGYEKTEDHGQILALSDGSKEVDKLEAGASGFVILDQTCFYAEGGGQVGDKGGLKNSTQSNGKMTAMNAKVLDCTKKNDVHLHYVEMIDGTLVAGDSVDLFVESSERRQTASNHSATHLLHSALRETLGDHVTQAGSLVDPTRLRFDFTHNKALSSDEIRKIEDWVNHEIAMGYDSGVLNTDPKTAIEKEGALALFGEKYGDEVRVIKMGPHSTELCGGTHVKNTAMIRLFKIVSEAGVSSGVRRIEALTGTTALKLLQKSHVENSQARQAAGLTNSWSQFLVDDANVMGFISTQQEKIKELQREIFKFQGNQIDIDQVITDAQTFEGAAGSGRLATLLTDLDDRKILSETADKLKNKMESGVIVVIGKSSNGGSHPLIVSVTKNLCPAVKAGNIVKELTSVMGGKGGGRPDFAQGGVEDLSKAPQGFERIIKSFS